MSEQDKFDDEAAEMLPCNKLCCGSSAGLTMHSGSCAWFKRPAVAARLRADAGMIETLKRNCEIKRETFEADQAELSQLRAQLESLHGKLRCNLRGCETNGTRHNTEDCPIGVFDSVCAAMAQAGEGER